MIVRGKLVKMRMTLAATVTARKTQITSHWGRRGSVVNWLLDMLFEFVAYLACGRRQTKIKCTLNDDVHDRTTCMGYSRRHCLHDI